MNRRAKETAEKLGWFVQVEDYHLGMEYIEFSKYTPAGQDFSLHIMAKGYDIEDLCKAVDGFIDDFDPDYEATLWQKDGHGIHGAPYRLKHIIKDFEEAQDMMEDLLEELRKIEDDSDNYQQR